MSLNVPSAIVREALIALMEREYGYDRAALERGAFIVGGPEGDEDLRFCHIEVVGYSGPGKPAHGWLGT